MKVWFNLLCLDIDAQLAFYSELLGWPEAGANRSPIYRALERDGVQLGFNAQAAYTLLNLATRQPDAATRAVAPVTAFATFMLEGPDQVDLLADRSQRLGGVIVKPPYATYYGQWQAVIADPEQHVFRLSAAGVAASKPPFG